jgi:hypothetical protein
MRTNQIACKQFHLRLPVSLLAWFRNKARQNRRTITAEMVIALESWRNMQELTEQKK